MGDEDIKIRQLVAYHPMMKLRIVKRFLNGSQYLKVTPKTMLPLVLDGLKKQFKENECDIMEINGWIRITKQDNMERLKKASERAVNGLENDFEEDPEGTALKMEANMLTKQGFQVTIEEVDL